MLFRSASGVSSFKALLTHVEERAPLHRNVTTADVGGAAAFLASSLANGVTGEVLYVDSGLHIMGV